MYQSLNVSVSLQPFLITHPHPQSHTLSVMETKPLPRLLIQRLAPSRHLPNNPPNLLIRLALQHDPTPLGQLMQDAKVPRPCIIRPWIDGPHRRHLDRQRLQLEAVPQVLPHGQSETPRPKDLVARGDGDARVSDRAACALREPPPQGVVFDHDVECVLAVQEGLGSRLDDPAHAEERRNQGVVVYGLRRWQKRSGRRRRLLLLALM